MPQPLAHLYDLALRALDDQERRAAELRGRLGPVLAAGGLATTLLAGPALRAGHPRGVLEALATVLALAGLVAALCGAAYLLKAHTPINELDPGDATRFLLRTGALEDRDAFYRSMIAMLGAMHAKSAHDVGRMKMAFTVTLCGILVEMCGFAVAAAIG